MCNKDFLNGCPIKCPFLIGVVYTVIRQVTKYEKSGFGHYVFEMLRISAVRRERQQTYSGAMHSILRCAVEGSNRYIMFLINFDVKLLTVKTFFPLIL